MPGCDRCDASDALFDAGVMTRQKDGAPQEYRTPRRPFLQHKEQYEDAGLIAPCLFYFANGLIFCGDRGRWVAT